MKTIIFDESSIGWTKNTEYNLVFLRDQEKYIGDRFKHRGYIYLNQICECFGIGWDPKLANTCYLAENGLIKFEFEPTEDDKILIHIS